MIKAVENAFKQFDADVRAAFKANCSFAYEDDNEMTENGQINKEVKDDTASY